jgi:hypothetical protein
MALWLPSLRRNRQLRKEFRRVFRVHKLINLLNLLPVFSEMKEQRVLIRVWSNARHGVARRVYNTHARLGVVYLIENSNLCCVSCLFVCFGSEGVTVKFWNRGLIFAK